MKKIFLCLIIIVCYDSHLTAQPPVSWQHCFGGNGNEAFLSIIQTSDQGFLLTGLAQTYDGDVVGCHPVQDVWIVKLDSSYNIQWQKCLGGSGYDWGIGAVETSNGYVIGCTAGSSDGDVTNAQGLSDFWFVKLDSIGGIIWQSCFGGSLFEDSYGITATPDGGFIMSGYALSFDGDVIGHHGTTGQNDFWLVKVDSIGNFVWSKCLGGTIGEQIGLIGVDGNGNIYSVCTTGSRNGDVTCIGLVKSVWMTKMNSGGNIVWDKCFGGSGNGTVSDEINSINVYENKVLLSGRTASSDFDLNHNYGNWDAWILVTDTAGTILLSQSYGGSQVDEFHDAKFTADNKIVAGGYTNSTDHDVTANHPNGECWVVCVDSAGTLLWQNTYGGLGVEDIKGLTTFNSKVLITGYSSTHNNGDVWGIHDTSGGSDAWLAELSLYTNIDEIVNPNNITIYPNPFSNSFNISFKTSIKEACSIYLYDAMGRLLRTIKQNEIIANNNLYLTIKADDLSAGLYYLSFNTDKSRVVKKIIKL